MTISYQKDMVKINKMPAPKRYATKKTSKSLATRRNMYAAKGRAIRKAPQTLYPDAPMQIARREQGVGFPKYNLATPFPPRWRVMMPYSEQKTLTASATNTFGTEIVYRLNSAYIPSVTAGSVKPFGYTQMAALYQTFRVYAVNIDITFSNPTEVEGTGMTVGALIQNSQGTVTLATQTYNSAAPASGADLRQLNNTGTQVVRIQRRFTVPQLETMRYTEWVANSDYTANTGANPAATPFLRLAVLNDVTLVQTSCTCLVGLTFETEWYNRLDLS